MPVVVLPINKEFAKLAKGAEEEGIAHTIKSLISIANTLDSLGLKSESDALDSTIKNLASEVREERDLGPIVDMASSLDEYGLHYVSDSLDAWLKKNR